MSQCAACQRRGPDARCATCAALYRVTAPAEVIQCLECGDGEMQELVPGWLKCGLCNAQIDKARYGERAKAEIDDITRGMVLAMLAEDKRQGEKGGGGSSDSKPKDALGGKVDPDTKTPGEGLRIAGYVPRRPDEIIRSKTVKIERKTEVVHIRGLDASRDECDEAAREILGEEVA